MKNEFYSVEIRLKSDIILLYKTRKKVGDIFKDIQETQPTTEIEYIKIRVYIKNTIYEINYL